MSHAHVNFNNIALYYNEAKDSIGPEDVTVKFFQRQEIFLYSYWHLISKYFLEILFSFQYITKKVFFILFLPNFHEKNQP